MIAYASDVVGSVSGQLELSDQLRELFTPVETGLALAL